MTLAKCSRWFNRDFPWCLHHVQTDKTTSQYVEQGFWTCGPRKNFWRATILKAIIRAAIDQEPKIRAAGENIIYYLKRKQMFLFARQRQIIRLPIDVQESFVLAMSYSWLPSCNCHEKRFFHLYLNVCAARLFCFYDVTKPWLQNVCDEIEMVCASIRHCLFNIVMLQKMRKNKDASHKWGHFLEIRTVTFSKT